ncbi:hypothetical protein OE09_1021 [Flavobacteriaceae bacterium MAR_2010_72]|nr:hypothetical protein OE09_1021 [Flavobacteriaceae bacterium MAR_2010_72]
MRIIIHLILIITISSCNTDIKSSKEYKELERDNTELKTELTSLKKTIDSLKNTPDNQFLHGQKLLAAGNRKKALEYFTNIAENHKGSEYENKSKKEIENIEKYFEEEKRKEELKKSLGFKILKPSSKIELENLTLTFSSIQFKKSFTFDSYGDRYFYRSAERGSMYLTASVSITSKIKDPNLPHILAYRLKDGILQNITTLGLEYRFRRWDDYGSYLGNSADYKNDFSHTKTIPFALGYEIEESEFKGYPIYIVLHKKLNIIRKYERFDNPPVSYVSEGYGFKKDLTIDDFDENGDYILIKRL